MAEQLEEYVFTRRGRRPGSGYPWGDWLNGKPWRLIKGSDFRCSLKGISQQACNHARRKGLRTRVEIESDTVIVIQTFKRELEETK